MKVSLYWLLATLVPSPLNGSEHTQPARGSCVVDNDGACVVETDDENSHQLMDAAVADLFGVEQELLDAASMQHFEKSKKYMTETVFQDESFKSVREKCRNRNSQCTRWASQGECDANPGYMQLYCAPACFSCQQVDRSLRCAFDDSVPKMWQEPGDLNRFFEHIVQTQPNATVHSGPVDIIQRMDLAANSSNANIPDGPWILTIDNFLTPADCEHLIQQGESLGYKRSKGLNTVTDEGEAIDVDSESRTSFNTWCKASCYAHPETQLIAQRINDLLAPIPEINSESWQLLKTVLQDAHRLHFTSFETRTRREDTHCIFLSQLGRGWRNQFP